MLLCRRWNHWALNIAHIQILYLPWIHRYCPLPIEALMLKHFHFSFSLHGLRPFNLTSIAGWMNLIENWNGQHLFLPITCLDFCHFLGRQTLSTGLWGLLWSILTLIGILITIRWNRLTKILRQQCIAILFLIKRRVRRSLTQLLMPTTMPFIIKYLILLRIIFRLIVQWIIH